MYLPAKVSIPGVEACRSSGFGGVIRASRGECVGRSGGVLVALRIPRLPFVNVTPGEGSCW